AGAFPVPDFCLIFAPLKGYDEPEILRSQLSRFGPISADAGQAAISHGRGQSVEMAEGKGSSTNSLEVCPTSRQHALVFVCDSSPPQKCSVAVWEAPRPSFGAPNSITLIVFSAHAFVVRWHGRARHRPAP